MNHALYDYFQDELHTPGVITAQALAQYMSTNTEINRKTHVRTLI